MEEYNFTLVRSTTSVSASSLQSSTFFSLNFKTSRASLWKNRKHGLLKKTMLVDYLYLSTQNCLIISGNSDRKNKIFSEVSSDINNELYQISVLSTELTWKCTYSHRSQIVQFFYEGISMVTTSPILSRNRNKYQMSQIIQILSLRNWN